jgi:hypothetical protein
MHDSNTRPEAPPGAFRFAGRTDGLPFMPRSPFSDAEERKLASELLEVTSEAELEQVLGDLSKKAWKDVEPVESRVSGPIEGLLKTVAKKALPSIAAAVGRFGGPERDGTAGRLGSLVNQAKVAGMTADDPDLEKCRQLFEKYRQFVRLAGKATRAAAAAPSGVTPVAVAQKILADSAKETFRRKPQSAGSAGRFAETPLPAGTMKATARARDVAEPALRAAATRPAAQAGRFAEAPLGASTMKATARAHDVAEPALRTAAMRPAAQAGRFAEAALAGAAAKTAAAGQASRRETPTSTHARAGRVCSVCKLPRRSCQCRKISRTGRWFRDGTSIVVNC